MATMKKIDNNNDHIIAKYLAGELSNVALKKIRRWLNQSDEHKQQLVEATQLWTKMENYTNQHSAYNVDDAWEQVKQRIQTRNRHSIIKTRQIITYASVAAAIMLAIFFWYRSSSSNKQVVVHENETIKNLVLADGSQITLNRGSTLTYPSTFNRQTRNVTLSGEAYFDIKNMPQKPFVVNTGINNIAIRVLGTSFHVKAYQKAPPEVTVNRGKVQIIQNNQPVIEQLITNERAYISSNGWVKEVNTNLNFLAWKTKKFTFMDAELADVAKQIESAYQCNIQFANQALNQCRLTAVFNKEEIDDIIQTICLAFDIEAIKQDNTYVLSGAGCR
jgi:ferric-dicitrate binding protein FerR (iron transport regulator)